jgi:hypothetical protein
MVMSRSPAGIWAKDQVETVPTAWERLNSDPLRTFGGGGSNAGPCPGADLSDHLRQRREVGWETVLAGHPTTANSGIREDGTKR